MAQRAREQMSRRDWLLAGLALPLFSARADQSITVRRPDQSLTVSFDGDNLRVSAPQLHFLAGKPLVRLMEGATVVYLSQITLFHEDHDVFRHAVERLTISYDVWEEKFKVVLAVDRRSASSLSLNAAEAWCLDNLVIGALGIDPRRPFWLQFDLRVASDRDLPSLVGDPGISMRNLIEFLARRPGSDQPHWTRVAGPLRLADLPRTVARGIRG